MQLSTAAHATMGTLRGHDATFTGVAIDSRRTKSGDLFVAIRGERHDGHEFAGAAAERGAVGVMTEHDARCALPEVRVVDTRRGLGALGASWRRRFVMPLIAITGSNGKTTVKNMLAAILGCAGRVLATEGNLNNELGVPLTLVRLRPGVRHAVIELGMNHPGEIGYLSALVRPDVAVITNAAAAHLEGLGSVENVARAKAEIADGLAGEGVLVINADDPFCALWRRRAAGRRCLTFGFAASADVRVSVAGSGIRLYIEGTPVDVALPLAGRHNAANAAAAAAAALAVEASANSIRRGLESVRAAPGRLERKRAMGGAALIDDTYNANPASLHAAVEVLAAEPGTRLLVLGDMAELGTEGGALHATAGREAREAGVDALLAVGPLSRQSADAFGSAAMHFDDVDALVAALKPLLVGDVTVLVKGSRSMRMERVVEALVAGGRD